MKHQPPISPRKVSGRQGFSLAEILVTMAIVSLVAVLLMPKIVASNEQQMQQLMRNRVSLATQQFSIAVEAFKERNDMDNEELQEALTNGPNANGTSYENIFFFNGNFFSFKGEGTGGVLRYFYFSDKSRMSFNPGYFVQGNYTNASLHADILAACDTGVATNPSRCFFLDVNGSRVPNAAGKQGDIIPFRINTTNFSVQTVYEATGNCNTVSAYDMAVNPAICP